jgi:hypothetical protein
MRQEKNVEFISLDMKNLVLKWLEDDILTSIDKEIDELTIRRKYLFEIIKKENNYNIF